MLGIDKRLIVPSTSRWLGIGIAAGIVGLVLSIALYWLIGMAIDGMARDENVFAAAAGWLLLLLFAKLAFGWLFRVAQYKASSLTKLTVRDLMYGHALRLGPAVLDKKRTGELVNTAVDGMDWIELFYGVYFVQFVVGIATPVVLCVVIGVIDWVVGLAVVASIPLTPLFIGMMTKKFREVSDRYAEVNNRQSAQFLDSLQGMTTLKMFNLGKARGQKIRQETEEQRVETMKLLLVNQVMILFVDFGFAFGTTIVLTVVALLRMDAGVLTAGEVVALVLISAEFARPLTLIGQFFFAGAVGREFARKIIAFLAEKPGVTDPDVAAPPRIAAPTLSLRNLRFSYDGADRPAVDNVSLDIRPGETVALVGQSGSGKTTITSLILRTLQPTGGTIALDGKTVEEVPSDWIRAHVALVPQDPYLFYGSIADNLRVAKPDATQAELEAAAAAANVLDFIKGLPAGFDTRVGERGLSLSGGQVQRVAIARALLKNTPIIILDEPTSQIDLETEAVIHEALERLTHNKTVLLIAHRLSTVEKADRIVVMSHGRVVESGSHAELMARNGAFARMVGTTRRAEGHGGIALAGGGA
jgi:ABC-type multidrug transport system fused ATPase/permease subunit